MKNKIWTTLLTLLLISIGLTILGYWIDNDPPVGLSTTIFEFIMMTIVLFLLVSFIYFSSTFAFKRVKKLFS